MEKYKTVIIVNAIIFIALGAIMGTGGLAFVGAVGVVQGGFNVFIGLITALTGNKNREAQVYLLCGGVLLLIGFSLCSSFPLRLN